ncbi:hypothetical protein HNP48_007010 [Acidovorax soli]|uniref:Uncharacterized protein n=1 Tax=Acidovorax soli TaxID=592050 RepID=A0A7X0UDM0_9BURK|nr:hypothetical protein [Acidovorax soli]MBB6564283.1 hypothetical protein [Acidovorax soli]
MSAADGPTAGRAGIHPWIDAGDKVVAEVSADGKLLAQLDHQATQPGLQKRPALVVALPVGLKRLRLKGQVTQGGKASSFDKTWTVRDMAPFSAPLYDQGKPWIERVRGLAAKLGRTVIIKAGDGGAKKKPAKAAFADLEKTLGVPLPPLVKVLGDWQIEVGDSYFLQAAQMRNVTDILLSEGGYERKGKDGLDTILAPAVRARYDRSLAVFIEVGDGLGALAWDPAGVIPGEAPNTTGDKGNPGARPGATGEGVWYWLHEGHINKPELLLDDDYRPKTAEAVFTHVFQRFALSGLELAESQDELEVDTANPRPNLLQLHFDGPRKPRLWLRSYDYHYSLY